MPGESPFRIEVAAERAGSRLDQFLAGVLGSRAQAQRLIEGACVTVDGRPRSKRYAVKEGDAIEIVVPAPPRADERSNASFGVAFEDQHLLIVDKPAGVVVHPARGHLTGTLSQALAGRAAGGERPWRAGIVHRLDRDTSGLLVVAKSERVHRALKALLAARELRREYLALVEGRPNARAGTVDAPIGRDRRDRKLMSIDSAAPRAARTHFEIERSLPEATLLRVVLDTGRTHQIRVHMAAIGHPVCGDPTYGTVGLFGLQRQFLHATRLTFAHPVTGEAIDASSALPAELREALVRAR